MKNELNLDELLAANGGNMASDYLVELAKAKNLYLESGDINVASLKEFLTADDMRKLSSLALNRPLSDADTLALNRHLANSDALA